MTHSPQLDAPLLERTDASRARPLPDAIGVGREDVLSAAGDLLAIPEVALTRPWAWIGGSEEEVRYGAYRAAEALEQAEVEARATVSPADPGETHAARIVGPATAAAWDLGGLLLSVPEPILDADPGGGEWTVRLTLGHVLASQRAYGWGTAWWLANPHDAADPDLPTGVPDEVWTTLPADADEAVGSRAQIRGALHAILDLGVERLAGIRDVDLALGARWSGFPVTIGFRLGRWASHIREHTIQVEKTLALLGHVPDEPARLARLVLAAYGRAEATVFGRAASEPVSAAAERIARGAAEAREAVRAVRAAADA